MIMLEPQHDGNLRIQQNEEIWKRFDMDNWDPSLYLSFENERLRPALDLLGQIPLENPKLIYDLGCGPGNVTILINELRLLELILQRRC
ncbi:MAG: Trans-aconitate 2-methyltransferase [Candidatus Heimdallarchaeota archaeon LC_3]|nr:MAG: Trans-aconitate 2-methyltransferase [Candidatus Heimdallarchaeota archaeon LC_3]